MVVITCKDCGNLIYLAPHAFWNIADSGARYEKCETINMITLENGNLKSRHSHWARFHDHVLVKAY